MLLDEPFAGIDPIAVGDIQDLVRHLTNRGIGVLITDHNVRETLGLTDRAYIVYAGQILTEGSPEEIVNDPDVRRLYLGEEFRSLAQICNPSSRVHQAVERDKQESDQLSVDRFLPPWR